MTKSLGVISTVLAAVLAWAAPAMSQAAPTATAPPSAPPPPPATKVEAFQPAAGTIFTIGYNDLGTIGYSIVVDARERPTRAGPRLVVSPLR